MRRPVYLILPFMFLCACTEPFGTQLDFQDRGAIPAPESVYFHIEPSSSYIFGEVTYRTSEMPDWSDPVQWSLFSNGDDLSFSLLNAPEEGWVMFWGYFKDPLFGDKVQLCEELDDGTIDYPAGEPKIYDMLNAENDVSTTDDGACLIGVMW